MTSTFNPSSTDKIPFSDLPEEVFVFPASFAQHRLWFFHQLSPESTAYNVSAAIRLYGTLDLTALERTINEIIRRHEILRTNLAVINDSLVQIVSPHIDQSIEIIDFQALLASETIYEPKSLTEQDNKDIANQELELQKFITQAIQYTFNLTIDDLFQFKLIQLNDSEYILLLVLHHIIADGWSIGILLQEFSALYTAFIHDRPSPLAELPIQYADFASWQQEWMQGERLETQLRYWQQQLHNLPTLELPTDRPRSPIQSGRGATQPIALSPAITNQLEELSQQEGVSLFMLLLATFQGLLFRYTGQTDIVIGTPIANRNRSELEGLIGFFVNSLVIRTHLSDTLTCRELLSQVRDVALAAYAHQDLPFEKLVQALQPQRDLSRHPLFQIAIALHNAPIAALELPGLRLEQFEFDRGTARLDLEMHFWQTPAGLQGQIIYSIDLFKPDTIDRLWQHFQTLLGGMIAQPDRAIAEIPLIPVCLPHRDVIPSFQLAKENALYDQNCCIQYQFEAQAQQTPNSIALVFQQQQLSYQELNQRSNQLAHYLQQIGVQTEDLIGICVDRSFEMVIAVLGALKAGASYVPLDPNYPEARLNFILADTQLSVVITQQQYCSKFNDLRFTTVCFDRDQDHLMQQNLSNLDRTTTGTHLAYVIYTSGSTGQPKGVLIEHHGLSNLIQVQRDIFNLQPTDRVLQFASLNFDASIFEMALAFGTGATLYLADQETLFGRSLLNFLRDQAITTVTLPPTILNSLTVEELPALQTIISAGEACTPNLITTWTKGNRRFFNAYGPTEATVWSTVAQLSATNPKPLIGHPIANTQLYVLDAHLHPMPIGVPGELYITGIGLARGYLNQPALTKERFITNPFIEKNPSNNNSKLKTQNSKLYKTGDRVRYQSDGSLEFLGRIDEQVKIRGYRIELGEVEAAISQHPAIQTVAVAARDIIGHQRLIAYITWKIDTSDHDRNLRHFLQNILPDYLIPTTFVELESLPLTANGKIDRHALQSISLPTQEHNNFTAPQTPTEEKLVKLWQQLLHLKQINVNDNFFDLGGDSLLAMRLVQEISQQFHPIPLATLFQAPTIAQLARLLEQSQPRSTLNLQSAFPTHSQLVPIQPNGSKPPFFCIHPIFGVVFPYAELAHCLGGNQPFYSLQPVGIEGETMPFDRIETMAAHYIKAIQTVQSQGPYLLGGWSFGGLVAFEMARQLQAAGQPVALLAILDAVAPLPINQPTLKDGVRLLLNAVSRSNFPALTSYVSRFITLHQAKLLPMMRVLYANSQAAYHYHPSTYAGQITLFKTAQNLQQSKQDDSLGWQQLTTQPVHICEIPGSHLTLLNRPHVQHLATQLQQCINCVY